MAGSHLQLSARPCRARSSLALAVAAGRPPPRRLTQNFGPVGPSRADPCHLRRSARHRLFCPERGLRGERVIWKDAGADRALCFVSVSG